jgi:hypothetical protein
VSIAITLLPLIGAVIDLFYFSSAINVFVLTKDFFPEKQLTFGYIWPGLLWGLFALLNLILFIHLLKKRRSAALGSNDLLLATILLFFPLLVSYALGQYYTFKAIQEITNNMP